jgi:hypothetical protein
MPKLLEKRDARSLCAEPRVGLCRVTRAGKRSSECA